MNPEVIQSLDNALAGLQDYVETLGSHNQALQADNQRLTSKLAEVDSVVLEKVAAAKKSALDKDQITSTLDRLVMLRILPLENHTKVAKRLAEDPNSALLLATQIAETIAASSEGYGVEKAAADDSDEDPDGWSLVAKGQVPRVRR